MKEVQNREEDFIKKMMDKSVLESPSTDFTLKIMKEITKENQFYKLNKPLISRQVWMLVFTFLLLLFSSAFYFIDWKIQDNSFTTLFGEIIDDSIWQLFSNLKFSKTLSYSLLVFSVFSLLQIFFIKSYFDKRFQS
ncbi:hypothetical protein SY27_17785 [Flavobacterium sp. 316]|uniref:hypothetical protein n=1 Tax=Flavobacterium sp. 316 TaxID=1603293 RepID=UPI0005DC4A03|nr:hypothetical protein [Flavobacterium sp. 316]KIX19662.1 hypothetical protein SY27_17785 [Flavobacterium sp. 316]